MDTLDKFIKITNNIDEYLDSLPYNITIDNINDKMFQYINKHYIKPAGFSIDNTLIIQCIINNINTSKIMIFLDNRIKGLIEEGKKEEEIINLIKTNIILESKHLNDKLISKKDFIEIYKLLVDFVIKNRWIEILFEEFSHEVITENTIIQYKETATNYSEFKQLELRINQIDAINRLEKNGLETGIHCQATGAGKSIIFLKYISYFIDNKIKGNIILFTERVNILADLFGFKTAKGDIDVNRVDETNKNEWKRLGIVDLDKIDVINRVTKKVLDWDNLLLEETDKPKLLVINRAYLTRPKMYKKFTNKNIGLVLHDECHSSTSKLCHDFLIHCKNYYIPTIGFSATPLRTGKIKIDVTESNIKRLLNIYGLLIDEKLTLNLLTNYSMINAISHNLILPPKFYWYLFDVETKKDIDKVLKTKNVTEQDIAIVTKILNEILIQLPNRKIIAWCGTIVMAELWKEMFIKIKNNPFIKEFCPLLATFTFYIDHSKNFSDYSKFKESDGDAIMFCANKHREGSDIKYLDCCMFLDKVLNRSPIPFIQSIGRVLRINKNCDDKECIRNEKCIHKTCGIVIDGFAKDSNNYEKEMVDKIIGYYMALGNLATSDDMSETKYDNYVKLLNLVEFDKENKLIKLKFNKQNIIINCNKLEWGKIIEKFEPILQEKIKLSVDDNFRHKAMVLKNVFNFNINTDFVKEYNKISIKDKLEYNLPDISKDEYLKLFGKKTWMQFLEIEHNYYNTMKDALIGLNKLKIKLINPKENWNKWCKMDNMLPPYPIYVWDNFKWTDANQYFTNKPKTIFV